MRLFLTIFLAVLLANLCANAITAAWVAYQASNAVKEATAALEKLNLELEEQQIGAAKIAKDWARKNAVALKAMQREQEHKASLNQRNREVCEFWKKEYRKTGDPYDNSMMITACKHSGQM